MKFFLVFLLFPFHTFAQDYTGVWVGTLYNDTTQQSLPYEIAISESNGKLTGFSHITFVVNGKEEVGVKAVRITKGRDKIFIEDESLVYNNYTVPEPKGVKKKSELSISKENSGEVLSGPFKINGTRNYLSLTGTIHLIKKEPVIQNKIIAKLDELKLSGSLSFLTSKTEKQEVAKLPEEKIISPAPEKKEIEIVYTPIIIKETPPLAQNKLFLKSSTSIQRSLQKLTPPVIILPEVAITSPVPENKIILEETDKSKEKEKQNAVAVNTAANKVLSIAQQKEIAKTPVSKQVNNPLKEVEKKIVEKEKPKDLAIKTQQVPTKIATPISQSKTKENIIASVPKQQTSAIALAPVISAQDLAKRKIETIKSVYFKTDSLKLTLYDNGEVDGDTVSILLNGRVIMPKQGLTTTAITKTIYITPDLGDSLQLIMYAENLGSLPPNTGLLIIQDGDDRYEIRFAGDLQKNSAIILRRNKSLVNSQ